MQSADAECIGQPGIQDSRSAGRLGKLRPGAAVIWPSWNPNPALSSERRGAVALMRAYSGNCFAVVASLSEQSDSEIRNWVPSLRVYKPNRPVVGSGNGPLRISPKRVLPSRLYDGLQTVFDSAGNIARTGSFPPNTAQGISKLFDGTPGPGPRASAY